MHDSSWIHLLLLLFFSSSSVSSSFFEGAMLRWSRRLAPCVHRRRVLVPNDFRGWRVWKRFSQSCPLCYFERHLVISWYLSCFVARPFQRNVLDLDRRNKSIMSQQADRTAGETAATQEVRMPRTEKELVWGIPLYLVLSTPYPQFWRFGQRRVQKTRRSANFTIPNTPGYSIGTVFNGRLDDMPLQILRKRGVFVWRCIDTRLSACCQDHGWDLRGLR